MNPAQAAAAQATAGGGAAITTASTDPAQAKKEKLENDPDFKKVLKALKMGVPPLQLRLKLRAEGKFDPDDLLIFLDSGQIAQLKKIGDVK